MALLPEGGGGDAEAGGLGPGLQDRGGLLPGTFGRVEGEQVEQVGDAGHQGEEGGKEGDEETSKDGRRPDWEKAPLGGCSRVVVPVPPELTEKAQNGDRTCSNRREQARSSRRRLSIGTSTRASPGVGGPVSTICSSDPVIIIYSSGPVITICLSDPVITIDNVHEYRKFT